MKINNKVLWATIILLSITLLYTQGMLSTFVGAVTSVEQEECKFGEVWNPDTMKCSCPQGSYFDWDNEQCVEGISDSIVPVSRTEILAHNYWYILIAGTLLGVYLYTKRK